MSRIQGLVTWDFFMEIRLKLHGLLKETWWEILENLKQWILLLFYFIVSPWAMGVYFLQAASHFEVSHANPFFTYKRLPAISLQYSIWLWLYFHLILIYVSKQQCSFIFFSFIIRLFCLTTSEKEVVLNYDSEVISIYSQSWQGDDVSTSESWYHLFRLCYALSTRLAHTFTH